MPSNKTFSITILCFAVIVSAWILQKKSVSSLKIPSDSGIEVGKITEENKENNKNSDWSKILTNMKLENSTTSLLSTNNTATPDNTTMTGQLAKDIFSRYLLVARGGQIVTPDMASKITDQTLASPQYIKSIGAVYLASNLHIAPSDNSNTVKTYEDEINFHLLTRFQEIKVEEDPMTIANKAMMDNKESDITQIDTIISANKGFVSDLFSMQVPRSAITLHLALLNASSNLLASVEAIRQVFNDPVRGMTGIGQYNNNMIEFLDALKKIQAYFKLKLGSEA